jgi:hypothetical protein
MDQNLHKVIEQSFSYELFCLYAISALLIFIAKYKLILCSTCGNAHVMPRSNFREFTLILSLLELFNLDLCKDIYLNA